MSLSASFGCHLSTDAPTVGWHECGGTTWLAVEQPSSIGLAIFGTPEQVRAFVESLAAAVPLPTPYAGMDDDPTREMPPSRREP